jgi:hypothetical protein
MAKDLGLLVSRGSTHPSSVYEKLLVVNETDAEGNTIADLLTFARLRSPECEANHTDKDPAAQPSGCTNTNKTL